MTLRSSLLLQGSTLALLLALAGGCAHYEFDLVEPPDARTHVGTKSDAVARIEPLEYRLRAAEGRLVMRIFNPGTDPVQLIGNQSAVVDPEGQSHPVRSQTIPPNAFIKLILPPLRPRIERVGPSFGVGLGVGIGYADPYDDPFYDYGYIGHHSHLRRSYYPYYRRRAMFYDYFDAGDPWLEQPYYLSVYDPDGIIYWDWKGQSTARLTLTYESRQKSFRHDLAFHRVKAK